MAEGSNSNIEHVCVLSIVPTIQTQNTDACSNAIANEVYTIIKKNYGFFPVYLREALKRNCEVQCTDFDIRHDNDVYIVFTCRFANNLDQKKFLMCVSNGQLTTIFTEFGESMGMAMDMGLEPAVNIKLFVNVLESQTPDGSENQTSCQTANQSEKDKDKVLQFIEGTHEEDSGSANIDNQNIQGNMKMNRQVIPKKEPAIMKKIVRVCIQVEPKTITAVYLSHKNITTKMRLVYRTHIWETNASFHVTEDFFQFSITVEYMPAGLLGYFRKEKHRSILLSEYSSVDYIFLVLGVPGIIPYHINALLEMLHHIVETVSRANTKEGVLQLDSIMGESALLPYYKLRLKNRSYRLDEAMYLLQDITVDEKNVIVYCYLIHILIAELSVISREKAIDSRKAQTILKACTKVMEKDVSSALLKRVAHVIQHLCKLVYKEEASILLLIDLFYDLFGNEIFLDLIEISLDDRKRVIGLYKPTKHLDCTFVLDRLYNFALADKGTVPLVERIFRHLPLSDHMDFVEEMKQHDIFGDIFETIEESLSFKSMKNIIAHGSKGDLESVLTLWQRVCVLCVDISKKMSDSVEKAIIAALDVEEKMVGFKSFSLLFEVVKEENLFTESTQQLKLLKLLSESKNHDMQQLFLNLLNHRKYVNLEVAKMSPLISLWFLNVLQDIKIKSGMHEKDKVPQFYVNFSKIIRTNYVMQHAKIQQKLEDITLKVMQKCKFKTMILAIPEIEVSTDLSDIYTKHISRILKDGYLGKNVNDIIQDICGVGSTKLVINSRTTLSIIKTTLDTIDIAEHEQLETIMEQILSSCKFWFSILTAEGKMVDEMKQHSKVKIVEAAVKNTISAINTQRINSKFLLLLLNKEIESKSLLYCMCEEKSKLEKTIKKYQNMLSDYQNDLKMIDDTFRKMKTIPVRKLQLLLNKSLDYIKARTNELIQGNITVQELSKTTPDIQIVQDISERCKHITSVVATCVFGNLTRQYFENNEEELEEIKDDPEDDILDELSLPILFGEHFHGSYDIKPVSLRSVLRIVEILVKECLERYKQIWRNYKKETEHSIISMRTMFVGITDMDKEINQAEKTCLLRLDLHTRNSLIRFSNIRSYSQTVDTIKIAAKAFKFDKNQDSLYLDIVQKFDSLLSGNLSSVTLKDMIPVLREIDVVHKVISSDLQDILQALKKSSALLDFLREVVDDDLRNLIDAVEEHSEQYVMESTVSDLIEIKRFFNPVLKGNFLENVGGLFELLQKQVETIGNNNIPEKIYICRDKCHSLKALYHNVANRGERTIEVIENVLQKGVFRFLLKSRACIVTVEYKQVKKKYKHSSADLSDLRSRALLLMNAEDKNKPKSIRKDDLDKFVHAVDEAFEVSCLCMQLKQSGHFEFSRYEENCRHENMNELKRHLQQQYEEWISQINTCRKKYYYLNFLYADQLYELYIFLQKDKQNDVIVMAILRFIDPSIDDLEKITEIYNHFVFMSSGDHFVALENIGRTLEKLFIGKQSTPEKMFACDENIKLTDKVQPGIPYITSLAEGSPLIIRTLLALYFNTTGTVPRANQVLFCRKDTTYDEISLLLSRCLQKQTIWATDQSLFAIANIELLPSEVQFSLHNEIRRLSKHLKGYTFLLCLICRGHENHPFLDQFSDMLSRPTPLSDIKLKQFLVEHLSHVKVITSDVPGLGKSEFIQRKSIAEKKRPMCIHISGSFNRLSIIEEMIKVNLKNYHVLHLDIGVVSDPVELDLFLFEMIVLRYASAGSTAYALPYNTIFIEIANTIEDELSDSLPTVTCFAREHLQWNDYNDLRASSEINSPAQVVCHYLKSFDDGLVDTTDLYFTGNNALNPLTSIECAQILRSHFQVSGDMSFTLMNIFINVLADQLKKLSASVFFRSSSLSAMLEKDQSPSVKSNLVKSLKNVSMDFASRSVNACRSTQTVSLSNKKANIAEVLAKRVSGMIRWEDSNHLVVLFHQNVQTVSALYRNVEDVSLSVRNLFESQVKNKLTDFKEKSTDELLNLLLKLTRKSIVPIDRKYLERLVTNYAITADNLLKMVLISLRVNSKVPVLIMGETGCGKTSLIRFLANVCDVKFEVFTIHAGVEETDITEKLSDANQTALQHINDEFWLFLDEINTCNHLGLITGLICHRMLLGNDLAPNLILLAACNPYRLRAEEDILTTGLQGKIRKDELSSLVYRVHPLPESLIDYVWDYGSLSEEDEKTYIAKMVDTLFINKELKHLFTETLVMSQHFVRTAESNDYCVSLRDVDRCRRLVNWFNTFLMKKDHIHSERDRTIRAIILGLAVCYHSRLSDGIKRRTYRQEIEKCIWSTMSCEITEEDILNHILIEQKEIVNMMTELPPGTALNAALQENVFILLVCILNKIPIFLVGKPGCSKSLSMQLIRSNLRGKDSTCSLFQEMPQLFCVSFQGSESSTSDGIIKVFEKAEKYQKHNDERDVLSVVILDEIGLAEISKFNPLKVLHGLIERSDEDIQVAVVGISNWALDAAKMNRAVHLSRPDMDLQPDSKSLICPLKTRIYYSRIKWR